MNSSGNAEKLLEEILIWTKANSFRNVEALLKSALTTENAKLAYQALDGKMTQAEVKKACSIGSNTLSDLISRCCAMGLMVREEKSVKRLFDLSDFGMIAPSTKEED